MNLINGKLIAEQIQNELKKEIEFLKQNNVVPKLLIIQVGDVQASNVYVKNKLALSEKLGAKTMINKLPEQTTTNQLINLIKKNNKDKKINGILVQMPLPKHIDENKIIEIINKDKDVDCFKLENVGKLWTARKTEVSLQPCTPSGIIQLLKRSNIEIMGKNVVIVGRSNIVGKPLASLFLLENATVTIAHSETKNLKQLCKECDILVCAIGKAKFINKDYVNKRMVVIDVGMNKDENNKLCGDVDFDSVKNMISHITPVPGGVGPMTVTMLMKNLIVLTRKQYNL